MTDEQLAACGISPGLIRVSCGLEDKEDAYPCELSGGQQSSNSPQQPHQQFLDFSADTNKQKAASQTPQNRQGVDYTLNISANSATKNIDKPIRRVTEIKVFYDDQTFDTFVLKK